MIQPKKRVYELARELNMTNKTLLDKISSLDLGLNSHMSTLDEDIEARIRRYIQGGPEPELEEMRVRPTVIRRRRKVAAETLEADQVQAAEEEAEAEVQAEPEEAEPEIPQAEQAAASAVSEDEAAPAAEPAEAAPEAAAALEEPAMAVEESRQAAYEERGDAEVTAEARPAAEADLATGQEAPAPDAPVAQEMVAAAGKAEPVETETQPAAEAAAKETAGVRTGEPVEPAAAAASTPAAPEEKPETVPGKPKPAVKTKKKKLKDTPAKIIRLPQRPTEVEPPEEKPAVAEPAAKAEPAGKDERPRKKAKGRKVETEEEAAQNRRPAKKKTSFRNKEVIEGAELYSDRQRPRKTRKGGKARPMPAMQRPQATMAKAIKRRVRIDETIVLSDLAKRMGIKASDMIAKLFGMGIMATVNQTIDFDTAALVAAEFSYEVEKATFEEATILNVNPEDDPEKMAPRPPVVTIMGHVDHGKTSLLDVIRKTRVTEGEAGGITQHIGAYLVHTERGDIAFLDTPGHEAFSAMRSRGAHITDIVILVVAADDGVMPQTVEAINHAKAAKVPIIVAVNKMDKPDADPERVRRQLAEIGVVPEEWGGENIFVPVSAKQKTGIDNLLEMILLQAEVLELKANPDKLASGHVVEAKLDSGRGPVATILVKEGTLKTGDAVVCGVHYGKVRALLDDLGNKLESAGPSMAVEIIGLSGVPMAGDEMIALKDDKDAKQVSTHRTQKQRSKELAKTSRLSLDKLYERMQVGEVKELNLIIKADVDGSLEAIRDSVTKLSNNEVTINVIHAATGTITESDISLAAVSDAIIIGFNVRPNPKVQDMANEEHVDIRYHNIIYNVIKEIKDAIVGMMESTFEERTLGRAEVRQVFHVPKVGTIAGCYVTDGKMERGQLTRLLRDGIVVYSGKNISLRRFKDDVKEVQSGYECGIGLENFNDLKAGDVLECYYMEEIRPEFA